MPLKKLLIALAFLLPFVPKASKASQPLSQAQLIQELLQNDKVAEAKKALQNLEGPEHQMNRFYGLIALKNGEAQKAIVLFKEVIAQQPQWKSTYLYLAQAQLELNLFSEAIESLEQCRSIAEKRAGYHRLLIRAHLGANRPQEAIRATEKALALFPNNLALQIDRVWSLSKIGLIHHALDELQELITTNQYPNKSIAVLARIARHAIRYERAKHLLERLLHVHPDHGPLYFEAGLAYAQLKHPKTAANLFERAHQLGHLGAFEAADQFRLASNSRKALELNAQVVSLKKKFNQRLNIYLSAGNYHRATALEPLLTKYDLLDDSTRFRLGYAFIQTGNHTHANQMAMGIKNISQKEQLTNLLPKSQASDLTTRVR
tara:strand:- start:1091 stop:2215 length:1125 start_codon:yes stop_codon:yes gene_type:complete